jgi:hypothetical protein
MSDQALRDAIKAVIQGADPLSLVHDYERWTNEPQTYVALFQRADLPKSPLRGWVFGPESYQELPGTHQSFIALTVWKVRFVYALQDANASEKAAWEIVRAVQALVRSQPTLNGACWSTRPTVGPDKGRPGLSISSFTKVQLGPVLCHFADCRLVTQSWVPAAI